ncbi:TPA: restriction endonuclease subunit S [Pseudomonas aeruginosa]|uniref:restriction endonuclease subunit S n=1 Tax=Pseudomonas aeruginosa TaxID=287 RepID=UPI00080BB65C|nr:restriction endonuclease subunit S [Pseudomonas aeruginosa]EKU8672190.1 restriction endonuclease subunit S [Pseudomonas aeruginosa]EKX1327976.1 restriction endonuclease subunit S [Pseudomonas aeruginosa]EKX7785669.1 restriction endonuclease subunit S [Pseudomonas aeruginosa]MBG6353087.1 restriction endonuclease subunit S [Pseudomonas aeruginosa]MDY1246665.1 restriction endonuclease subunit S [Pseudomonas aeruginosa]
MSNWQPMTIGQFLSLQRGYDLTGDEREVGNIPVVGAAGQNGFHNKALASAPGVVVGRCGGSFGQVYFSKEDFWPHNTAMFVTDFKGNDPYFAYYLLKSIDFSKLNSGSAQPSLNRNYVYPTKIIVPKPPEQRKIAAVLAALDAKIDCNKRINAELEAMAKSLYDYWFVQFDFPCANGDPYKSSGGKMVYNASLKREIPEGWAAAPLSSITPVSNETLNPAVFPEKSFKHFSIPVFDVTKTYGVELGRSIGSSKFTVLGVDLLVSKLNPWSNRVVYAMDEADQVCSTEFVVWRSPSENLKNFLYFIATSQQFISHCVQSASGTSSSHKRVNPSVMMRFELPYEERVAAEFGKMIDPILKKLIVNQRENQYLAQLRDWLLPMLMNGQVIVA